MSELPLTDRGRLPLDVLHRIDEICNRFEAGWEARERPRIEDALELVDEPHRAALLRDLLAAEIDARRRRGEQPLADEYAARFPGHEALIAAAFSGARKRRTSADSTIQSLSPAFAAQATATITPSPTRLGAELDSLESGTVLRYFGDYEIEHELGRGGMGVVYKARQISLNRPVALKMIRAGVLADAEELRRFQNEAEAVALLDHPHIVPVYEVGEHEGQKYFTMKLVHGGSLGAVVDRYGDDPRGAARLAAEAAEAVHHAHQRGILHRDLKPGNILVDDQGMPHVTDFGLAKRLEGDSELSHTGQILGTPAYMAPEQASGRRGAVTTVTDVYGLGAILYALLTGKPPFGGGTVADTLEQVRNQEPAPPTKHNARVPRDLETICLKCLEKDSKRRYPSALALADDLHNWLELRPIAARRVGTVERAWLWCKRKPAVAALAAGVLISLIGGLIGTGLGLRLALQREKEAISHAAVAHEQLHKTMESIASYYTGVSEEFLLSQPAMKALRERLLEKPRRFYEELAREVTAKSNPTADELGLLSEGHFHLGRILQTLESSDDARAQFESAVRVNRVLAARFPNVALHHDDLATSLGNLGLVLYRTGQMEDAENAFKSSLSASNHALTRKADETEYQHVYATTFTNLGQLYLGTGRADEGVRALERARGILESIVSARPGVEKYLAGLAQAYTNLAIALSNTGQSREAEQLYERAVQAYATLAAAHPEAAMYRDLQANCFMNLANLYVTTGRIDEAEEWYGKAIGAQEALADEFPNVPGFRNLLGKSYNNLGMHMRESGRLKAAGEIHRKAVSLYEALVQSNPDVPDFQNGLVTSHTTLGVVYALSRQMRDAETAFRGAIAAAAALCTDHPSVPEYHSELASGYLNLGCMLLDEAGRDREAAQVLDQAVEHSAAVVAAAPMDPEHAKQLGVSLTNRAQAAINLHELDVAEELLGRAISTLEESKKREPRDRLMQRYLRNAYRARGNVLDMQDRITEAEADWERVIELSEGLGDYETVAEQVSSRADRRTSAAIITAIDKARSGEPHLALQALRTILDRTNASSVSTRYNLACALSVCAGAILDDKTRDKSETTSRAEELSAQAVDLLRQAHSSGFFDRPDARELLRGDHDLDALRGRRDFQLFLLEVDFPVEPFARAG